jgi:hypothetical protein
MAMPIDNTSIILKEEENYLSMIYYLIEHNKRFTSRVVLHKDEKTFNYYTIEVINER